MHMNDDCTTCKGKGIKGGCPECGIWPTMIGMMKTVGDMQYFFEGNVVKESVLHKKFLRLTEEQKLEILFEDNAINRFNRPIPKFLALWTSRKTHYSVFS